MRPNFKILTALIITLILATACKPTLVLSLQSPDERVPSPRFRVEDPARPGQRPRYDTIKLADAAGEIIWHLRAEPFGDQNSVETVSYGITPQGFAVVIPAKPLEPNHDYILGVIGKALGTLRVHVDADGRVQTVK